VAIPFPSGPDEYPSEISKNARAARFVGVCKSVTRDAAPKNYVIRFACRERKEALMSRKLSRPTSCAKAKQIN
jgi:hypothetical protein